MATPERTIPNWVAASSVIAVGLLTILGFVSLVTYAVSAMPGTSVNLPMLVIAGVIALLGALAFIVVAYSFFGLHDRQQALGLPEGSVRALVAMMLIIIFSIFVVYFFDRLDTAAKPGQADFAKQVITLIGTLLTAIVSFYFASRTSTDAVAAVVPEPTISGLSSASGTPGGFATVTIAGQNLQTVTKARLVRGAEIIEGSAVVAAANSVTATFAFSLHAVRGKYNLVLETADGKSVRMADAFEVM
jgi:hypothetical protein